MFELIMMYCLADEPCAKEVLAIFPSEDVGRQLCDIARPAITDAIRARVDSGAVLNLSCVDGAIQERPDYSPRQRDNRVTMADPGKVSPVDVALDLIDKLSK